MDENAEMREVLADLGVEVLFSDEDIGYIVEAVEPFLAKMGKEAISSKELEGLVEDSQKLSCLECAGVDNWSGYSYAMADFYAEEGNE